MIFLFFSSSLACLEPELELFEVWEINVQQIIIIANGINIYIYQHQNNHFYGLHLTEVTTSTLLCSSTASTT